MVWLRLDVNYVNSVVEGIASLTNNTEIHQANFSGTMIYQRLIVYIFAHLMLCTSNQRPLNDLKEILREWRTWDIITVIEKHQLIRDYLMGLYRRDLQSRRNLHSGVLLRKLLTLDDIALCSYLTVMVCDDDAYKQVIRRDGSGAQALLNLLQARLNFAINPEYKLRHVKALIRLSRSSGLYPECLVLKGMHIDRDAVAGGSFGDVHRGLLEDQEVAVKILKIYQQSDRNNLLKAFSSEAVTWRQLSHPNVLPFYGVYHLDRDPPRVCLACPWMKNGNIVQFLATRTADTDCVLLSLDVAHGLEYLHGENIIHGDLKGLNILISQELRACIADFGLATVMHSAPTIMTYMTTNRTSGTLRWQAPELLPDMTSDDASDVEGRNTKASDIYAFALVCYEMFSGKYPFQDIANDLKVIFTVRQGKRPARPAHDLSQARGLNDEIWHFIETCWHQEPSKRPTATHIVQRLRALPDPSRPADQRPPDSFGLSFPSQALRNQLNRPFSTLVGSVDDMNIMEVQKRAEVQVTDS